MPALHASSRSIARPPLLGGSRRRALPLAIIGTGMILAGVSLWLFWPRESLALPDPRDLSAVPMPVDFPAPLLVLRDLTGKPASLSSYLGEVVLVNIWTTWCPPCREEMPVFQAFYREHQDRGFTVVAINDGESRDDVQAFAGQWGLTFPIWLDPKYEASERAFRTTSLPTSYVVDRQGTVRLMWIGAINKSNMDKYLKPILEE